MYVNPTFYLVPLLALTIGILPVIYFGRDGLLFVIAAPAYFLAIAGKVIVEGSFPFFFNRHSILTYAAYGVLTAVLEIGLAYLFVRFYKGEFRPWKGWAYGSYLAFFENAIYIGILSLFTLLAYQFLVSGTPGQDPYSADYLLTSIPVGFERLTSFVAHAVWGYIAFFAAAKKKPFYVLLALPLASIDSVAAWWDLTHAISYPLLITILLLFVIALSATLLISSGMWKEAREGLSRRLMRKDEQAGI